MISTMLSSDDGTVIAKTHESLKNIFFNFEQFYDIKTTSLELSASTVSRSTQLCKSILVISVFFMYKCLRFNIPIV